MFFSKSLTAAIALCLSISLQVNAHAIIVPALGVSGTAVRSDVQRPKAAKPCGKKINIAQNIDSSTAIPVSANGSFAATVTNFNLRTDGSRQVTAQVDVTGAGTSFVDAEVLQNGDKSPTDLGSQPLVIQLPAGTTCTGGATGDKCLVSFVTAGRFGNCVVVQQGADGSAAAAGTDNSTATATDSTVDTTTATDSTVDTTIATDSTVDTTTATDSTVDTATASNSTVDSATATGSTVDIATVTDSTAATSTSSTDTTSGTGKNNRKGAAAKAKAAKAAKGNTSAIPAAANQVKRMLNGSRVRAIGTRAARIARRAAERGAVEVLA